MGHGSDDKPLNEMGNLDLSAYKTVIIETMKPGKSAGAPIPLKPTRLLDQVRERIRYLHYSLSTETTYVHWVKFFVRWHGRNSGGPMRHPREMGAREVEAFLECFRSLAGIKYAQDAIEFIVINDAPASVSAPRWV
jgi:Phage integrase, N-terminal SAM-like domain